MFKRIFFILIIILICSYLTHASTYIKGPALIQQNDITAKIGGTTSLTTNSQTYQIFTGTASQTVALPNATTIPVGRQYVIKNSNASGTISVQDGAGNALTSILPTVAYTMYLRDNSAASGVWNIMTGIVSVDASGVTGILPVANGGTGTGTQFTTGSVVFADGSGVYAQDNSKFFWDDTNFRLGLLTTTPTSIIGINGSAAANIGMERNASGVGKDFTLTAGGTTAGLTDSAGGQLTLKSGQSTGTGASNIIFQTFTPNASSASSDNTATTKMTISGVGNVGIGTTPAATTFLSVGTARSTTAAIGSVAPWAADIGIFVLSDTFSSGAVSNLVGTRLGGVTYTPTSAVTVTTGASIRVQHVLPAASATISSDYGLWIQTANVSAAGGIVTNAYGMRIEAPSGGTSGNYAASFSGNIGAGNVIDPGATITTAAQGVTQGTNEQLELRGQRAAIVTGNILGGINFRTNDTNLTAPGLNVAFIDAVATATHTASITSTKLDFWTTNASTPALAFTIGADGTLTTPGYAAGNLVVNTASGVVSGNGAAGTLLIANGSGTQPSFGTTASSVISFTSGIKLGSSSTTMSNYEEGTCATTFSFAGTNGNASATTACRYTTIGNRTLMSLYSNLTKGTASGALSFASTPKASANVSNLYQACAIANTGGSTIPANRSQVQAYITPNTSTVSIIFNSSNGGTGTALTATDLATTAEFIIVCDYQSQ